MNKLGFGIIGLVAVAALYYFTAGSSQITQEMKKQVNAELTTLQQNGFSVQDREIKEGEEHFVISIDDPAQVTSYLKSKGVEAKQEELLSLKGFKLGIDAKYLNDTYSALSVDIYPVALPNIERENKKAIARIQKMIATKTLLVHLDFNKLLSGFKGYVKDINETFVDEVTINIASLGVTFEGTIEEDKVKTVDQKVEHFSVNADKELMMKLYNLTGQYTIGKSSYNMSSNYSVETIELKGEKGFSMIAKNAKIKIINSLHDNLLKSDFSTTTDSIEITESKKTYVLNDMLFDFKVDNLDIAAFEALQHTDINDEKAVDALYQKILSKDITLNIPNLSVKTIEEQGKIMDGFSLNSALNIDKSFDFNALSQNPLAALDALNTKTHIELSPELFALVAQDPKAMMAMMFFPPVEKEGKKVYEVEFIKGKLTVNGAVMF